MITSFMRLVPGWCGCSETGPGVVRRPVADVQRLVPGWCGCSDLFGPPRLGAGVGLGMKRGIQKSNKKVINEPKIILTSRK